MAGEEEVWKGPWGWNPLGVAERLRELDTPWRRAAVITIAFVLVAFVAYQLTSMPPSIFNHPVRLADAFLHGRLDVANARELGYLDWAIYDGKYYPLEPPGTAIIVLPAVLIWGLETNQTFVSVIVGALAVGAVYQVMRGVVPRVSTQIWLTILFAFGTVFWWNATYGAVWYFNHAAAVLFLFIAAYECLVAKRPFTAGLALGAAYICRLPAVLTAPFFVVMFFQLKEGAEGVPIWQIWRKVEVPPLAWFGAGLGLFVLFTFIHNYIRFDTPLHASYYYWHALPELEVPGGVLEKGLFNADYIKRHLPVFFERTNYLSEDKPFWMPSWGGAAFWATTPVFLYALFAGIKSRAVRIAGWASLLLTITFFSILPGLGASPEEQPWFGWADWSLPLHLNLLPFILLIGYSMYNAFRTGNRLVLACWLGIIPVAMTHFTVAVTGWPQFGYRYLLDYAPLVLLLTWQGLGNNLKPHHVALIVLSVALNAAGVLWINKFDPNGVAGIRWVNW